MERTSGDNWPEDFCLGHGPSGTSLADIDLVFPVQDTLGNVTYHIDRFVLEYVLQHDSDLLIQKIPLLFCDSIKSVDRYYKYDLASALFVLGDTKWLSHLLKHDICTFSEEDRRSIMSDIHAFGIEVPAGDYRCD
jgi:hypothetical protein